MFTAANKVIIFGFQTIKVHLFLINVLFRPFYSQRFSPKFQAFILSLRQNHQEREMKTYPVILTIAGSDCSGGAGIQADMKTISALGGYAATAITAVTVQNTLGVSAVYAIPAEIVRGQIEAVMDDLHPVAVKIGMVYEEIAVKVIADCLRKYTPEQVVYDPVMVSTSGRKLMEEHAIKVIERELFPLVSLITPNLNEAEILTGKKITSLEDMKKAAAELAVKYGTHILLKGGHLEGNEMTDVLYVDGDIHLYKEKKIMTRNLHGTGCTLSSSIATYLALGYDVKEAVGKAKAYVSGAIAAAKEQELGHGNGPLCHL